MAQPSPASSNDQRSSRLPIIIGAVVVLVAVAVGGFLFLTRDTSDPELTLTDDPSAGTGEAVDVATLDGSWTVAEGTDGEETEAGYRVKEVFAAGSRKAEANGRTKGVTGTLTVADGSVTEGTFTVDMTTLESDEGRRDSTIKNRGLESNTFPEATFAVTEPIELPADLADGATFEVTATGDLTLHGVTQPVTIDLTGKSTGGTFTVQGSAPIQMADYDIEPPNVGGFVTVEDTGSFEFIVNFEKS